jgi:phosphoglycerate dehydrogenase-like enzyme
MKKLVVALPDRLIEPEYLDKIRALAPGYEVVQLYNTEDIEAVIDDIEIAVGLYPPELVSRSPNLKWMMWWWAGVEFIRNYPEIAEKEFILTNSSGVHAVPMAEHTIGMMLCLSRNLLTDYRRQLSRTWDPGSSSDMSELEGKQVLIVGYGKIGQRLGRVCKAFDMEVRGIRRNRTADSPYADSVGTPDTLDSDLPSADYVVLILPNTERAEKAFGTEQFSKMKRSAYFVNIGRGKTVDETALYRALKEGRIAGAALDVFEEEPLPEDSPLWDLDNVLISPHHSGWTPDYWKRIWPVLSLNLRNFMEGKELVNIIDKIEGY